MASLPGLPLELLLRIFDYLRPAVLVRLRTTCRTLRDAVNAAVARDRRFAYVCGHDDLIRGGRRYTNPPRTSAAAAAASAAAHDDAAEQVALVHTLLFEEIKARVKTSPAALPCTCGLHRPFRARPDKADARATPDRLNYSKRHGGRAPPAYWRHLAQDRALAQQVTDICGRLDARLFVNGFTGTNSPEQPLWFPYVLHLGASIPLRPRPPRPTDAESLIALVEEVFDLDGTVPDVDVRALEDAMESDQALADGSPPWIDSVDDWIRQWVVAKDEGELTVEQFVRYRMDSQVEPWWHYDEAEMDAELEGQREALLSLPETLSQIVAFPLVISGGCYCYTDGHRIIAGLSPNGNLVGAFTTHGLRTLGRWFVLW